MNRNLVELDNEYKEEEIDIYQLIDIFIRNIKTFVIIFIIGLIATALFVGKKVLLDKKNVLSIQYTLNYDELESYLNGKVFYPKKSPTDILLDDKYLEKLFENKELKSLYEASVTEDRENITTKRRFLNNSKILENLSMKKVVSKDEEESVSANAYKLTVKTKRNLDKDKKIAYSILESYLEVLKNYYQEKMFSFIGERKKFLEKSLPILKKELEKNAVDKEGLNISSTTNGDNYLKYVYPIKVSNIDSYYPDYTRYENEYQAIKNMFELNLDDVDNFIKYDSSIIEEKVKSKNLMFLGIGIFLSFALGVVGAFGREFVKGYKKSR